MNQQHGLVAIASFRDTHVDAVRLDHLEGDALDWCLFHSRFLLLRRVAGS